MTRKGILVSVACLFVTIGHLPANDELAITELYGQAVHAYFSGDYEKSHKNLSEAVELGTDDPRVYYFRGLAKLKLGRGKEAQSDFDEGGKLEAAGPAQYYPIGRSLERVQGAERMMIEKVRKQARLAIRLRQKKIEQARIEAFKRDERLRSERSKVKLGNPMDNSASDEDPFGAPAANPPAVTKPAVKNPPANKPSDDPFGAPAKPAPKNDDPFGAPAKPAPKNDDPFGAPAKPAPKNDDPFGAPAKPAPKNDDPFGAPTPGNSAASGSNAASPLPAEQQAKVGILVDLASLMKDETVAAGLKAVPNLPGFVKSLADLNVYVSLPSDPTSAMNPASYDFYASVSFADAGSCQQAFAMAMAGGAPLEDAQVNGKTFKKLAELGMPTIYILQSGSKIELYSENYVKSGAKSFAGKGLQTAIQSGGSNVQYKIAVDVAGAKNLLSSFAAMLPPQAEAFINSNSLVLGGGSGETILLLAVDAGSPDNAKKVKSSIQASVAALAVAAGASLPPEEVAPATNEMFQHVMKNLKPEVEGNQVKVSIPRPSNYDELAKKIAAEAQKITENVVPN